MKILNKKTVLRAQNSYYRMVPYRHVSKGMSHFIVIVVQSIIQQNEPDKPVVQQVEPVSA